MGRNPTSKRWVLSSFLRPPLRTAECCKSSSGSGTRLTVSSVDSGSNTRNDSISSSFMISSSSFSTSTVRKSSNFSLLLSQPVLWLYHLVAQNGVNWVMLSLTFCLADRASEVVLNICWKVLNLQLSIPSLIVVVEHHLVSLLTTSFLLQLELGNFCCLIEFGCHR